MNLRTLLLPIAALALQASCSRNDLPSGAAAAQAAAKVRIEAVRLETVQAPIEIAGMVRPVRRATLAAKLMGSIEEMPVTLGQRVKVGDVLIRISAGEVSARLAQAQAQLGQAEFDLARERDLLAKSASTADIVRNLETRVALSKAAVREAETLLGYAVIRAPFDGVVERRFAEVGDLASPGLALLEVEGSDSFQVEADIPDSLSVGLKQGLSSPVSIPSAGLAFTATISELSSSADPSAHTVTARFAVPAGVEVRSGQFARVQLAGAPTRRLLAPSAAVSRDGQMERVFVEDGGHRAVLRLVRTGADVGDRVEILSGLDDGERLVVSPPAGLREGQALEALP
jgi:RND family efflux transporter MFP subunit